MKIWCSACAILAICCSVSGESGVTLSNSMVLLACAFCTFAMTGLIWLIQLVQYPLMSRVGPDFFVTYEQLHCRNITPIVLPLMTVELATSVWLAWRPVAGAEWLLMTGCGLVGLLWASTFFLQVPMHDVLCQAFDAGVHRRLVQSNWIRTGLWSARSALMLWVLAEVLLRQSPRS